ncbi:unnamed protein product [Polarella glacialis]|uniref:Uncharacterized protein n=1 Tax=Polarella glacialis TaxID=89957 RepID=A0A813LEU8_POLGL|nr:unnamed protein product [Polarella glacialis]
MDNIEQAHIAEQREIHRFSLRERLRQNKGAKDEWNTRSADLWQDNMQVRLSREAADVRFNNRTFHMQQEKLDRTRDFASTDVHRGVKDFETGLATLGLSKKLEARTLNGIPDQESSEDDDEDLHPERLLAQTTKAATGRDLVEALQSRLPSGQELEQEAGLLGCS